MPRTGAPMRPRGPTSTTVTVGGLASGFAPPLAVSRPMLRRSGLSGEAGRLGRHHHGRSRQARQGPEGLCRSASPLGHRAHLRLDRPLPQARPRLRGHPVLRARLLRPRSRHDPRQTTGATLMKQGLSLHEVEAPDVMAATRSGAVSELTTLTGRTDIGAAAADLIAPRPSSAEATILGACRAPSLRQRSERRPLQC